MIRRRSEKNLAAANEQDASRPPLPGQAPGSRDNKMDGAQQQQPPRNLNGLPDIRLSGFDVEKMMGGHISPMGTPTDEDDENAAVSPAARTARRDYIASGQKQVSSSIDPLAYCYCGHQAEALVLALYHLPQSPALQRPPPLMETRYRASPPLSNYSTSSSSGRSAADAYAQQQQPPIGRSAADAYSSPPSQNRRPQAAPPVPNYPGSASSRRGPPSQPSRSGTPRANSTGPKNPANYPSYPASPPQSATASRRPPSSSGRPERVRPAQSESFERFAGQDQPQQYPAPSSEGANRNFFDAPVRPARATNRPETDDERRAREWEEARERQNESDRRERYEEKARQAEEERERIRAEAEAREVQRRAEEERRWAQEERNRMDQVEQRRREAAYERAERERKAREAEAARLRAEEEHRKAEIKRRHEAEMKRREEEEIRRKGQAALEVKRLEAAAKRRQEEEAFRKEQEILERQRREAEAKARAEEAKRKEEERKRRAEAARLAKIQREKEAKEARIKAAQEAEAARLKAIEDAEKVRIKAIEDAEKARLEAIEDEKKAIEKAKADYIQAIANGHAAVDREDQHCIAKCKQQADQQARWVGDQNRLRREAEQNRLRWEEARMAQERAMMEQRSADSGVSMPGLNGGGNGGSDPNRLAYPGQYLPQHGLRLDLQQGGQPLQSILSVSPTPTPGAENPPPPPEPQKPVKQPKRSMTDRLGWGSKSKPAAAAATPVVPAPTPPSTGEQTAPTPEGPLASDDPNGTPKPANAITTMAPVSPPPAQQTAPHQVKFAGPSGQPYPQQPIQLLPPPPKLQKAAVRFASALSVGARGPALPRSPLNFAPAIRTPWDAGVSGASLVDSHPATLAQVACELSTADTSDPTKGVAGIGWYSLGEGDPSLIPSHYSVVNVKELRLVRKKIEKDWTYEDAVLIAECPELEYEEVWEEFSSDALIFDLFGPLFASTGPAVLERIVAHLDCADVKALRQSCRAVRSAFDADEGREVLLRRFLEPVGYRTWQRQQPMAASMAISASRGSNISSVAPSIGPARSNNSGSSGNSLAPEKDPLPLNFADIEAFLMSADLATEYAQVAADWKLFSHEMDPRVPRLARASTRAYSRVLNRLRMQPSGKANSSGASSIIRPRSTSPNLRSSSSSTATSTTTSTTTGRDAERLRSLNTLQATSPNLSLTSPTRSGWATPQSPALSVATQHTLGPQYNIASPLRSGKAPVQRVWAPMVDASYMSDDDIARMERELFLAGVWPFLRRGDIVSNLAVPDEANHGKMIFDGQYLRDLAVTFDPIGHLPSWLNLFLYSPGFYHNIIRASTPSPVVYLDILPWREQIVSSLRLVQDHVETITPTGARYRIGKWVYRSSAIVKAGQIISDEGVQCTDEGWEGQIVFETDGIQEHAKDFIARCAGPRATPQAKATLLAAVLGGEEGNPHTVAANRKGSEAILKNPAVRDAEGKRVPACTPFAVLRERSRPGLIWLRPVMEREKVQ